MPLVTETADILPNILITGTPCVGKSTLCKRLAERLNLKWLDCSKIAVDNDFVEDEDAELECPIIDEDQLLDYLEPLMQEGGNIVEYHSCEFFPERWFDAVFVLTCNNTLLYDRMKERGYNEKKLKSNIECEIFGAILEEAQNSYKPEIVHELKSETKQDSEECFKKIKNWYKDRKKLKSDDSE